MDIRALDAITERLIGIGCIAASVTEAISPDILSIDISQGWGIGAFGVALATGKSKAVINALRRAISEAGNEE